MEPRSIISAFVEKVGNVSIKHTLLGWHEREQCLRHPKLPVGFILRDQGIVDVFAGRARILVSMRGDILNSANSFNVVSQAVNIRVAGIKNFKILNKHPNQQIFDGQHLAALKTTDLTNFYFIDPSKTRYDSQTNTWINPIPAADLIEPIQFWDEESEISDLLPAEMEIYNTITATLKGVI